MDLQNKWGKGALIALAIIMASGSFWISKSYLSQQEAILTNELTNQYSSKTQIIVANSQLEPGQFMSSEVLAIADVPDQYLPVDVILPDQFSQIEGLEIKRSVPAGKPVLLSYLGDQIARKFSDTIPVGFRAITIEVDTLNSHENMIEVGDQVDLFLLDETVMSLIKEQVTVLATGNLRSASQDPDGTLIGDDSNYSDYQSLTLLLPLDTLATVRHADQKNTLLVLLRNSNDKQPVYGTDQINATNTLSIPFLSNKQSGSALNILNKSTGFANGSLK